ncbi:DegT/DnrJ/EryC1/StrS aminotransferase family [Synechococcus sp. PCC 7335]|uniref:DegT/DnrJ/EryC1/StrS family aminotransferase n=1 Tax=Synechococcus sp. (strain ATCC 29403 / PCC 7335) TaxID=91464 RepID=UPI00017EC38D|nr:DegT/DnrJ/EryC1/StrS family aminotransferase [Synechococcus sp. PCC 7335]EDX84986.1 DegT/DnrJ/EryC1/StrS aminotransferase family [Synechococcus sp. PCC 7335]
MIPRKQLDIRWTDILFGLKQCVWPFPNKNIEEKFGEIWTSSKTSNQKESLICLSVRSGFDALLTTLNFQPGDEILVSAITIHGVIRIIEAHNLVPVPIDIDPTRLAVCPDSMAVAVSDRTKAIVIAHLFGSRMPMEPILQFAKNHNLFVIEDCAQAYTGNEYCGHPQSDVSLFSFGPIKTNTALAAGVLHFRERSLWRAVRLHQEQWPRQSQWQFCKRIGKYTLLKALSYQAAYTLFVGLCSLQK